MNGSKVSLSVKSNLLFINDSANVTDRMATDGVIHVVDALLTLFDS